MHFGFAITWMQHLMFMQAIFSILILSMLISKITLYFHFLRCISSFFGIHGLVFLKGRETQILLSGKDAHDATGTMGS